MLILIDQLKRGDWKRIRKLLKEEAEQPVHIITLRIEDDASYLKKKTERYSNVTCSGFNALVNQFPGFDYDVGKRTLQAIEEQFQVLEDHVPHFAKLEQFDLTFPLKKTFLFSRFQSVSQIVEWALQWKQLHKGKKLVIICERMYDIFARQLASVFGSDVVVFQREQGRRWRALMKGLIQWVWNVIECLLHFNSSITYLQKGKNRVLASTTSSAQNATTQEPLWQEFDQREVVVFVDPRMPKRIVRDAVRYVISKGYDCCYAQNDHIGLTAKWGMQLFWKTIRTVLSSRIGVDQSVLLDIYLLEMKMISNLIAFWKLLKIASPKVLFPGTETDPASVLFCAVARSMHVKTFCYFNGIKGTHPQNRFNLFDKMFVWGDYLKELFVTRLGYPEDSVEVAGFWRDAEILHFKEKVPENTNTSATHRLIAFFSSGPGAHGMTEESQDRVVKSLLNYVAQRKDVFLVIKTHPAAQIEFEYWKSFPQQYSNVRLFRTDEHLYELIRRADLVVTTQSSVAFEALLFDKPLLLLNFTTTENVLPFARENAAIELRDETEVSATLDRLLYDLNFLEVLSYGRRQAIQWHIIALDGLCHSRMAQSIYSLAGEAAYAGSVR